MIPSLNMLCTACNPTSLMSAEFHSVNLYSIVGTVSEDIICLVVYGCLLGCILNPLCLFLNCLLGSILLTNVKLFIPFSIFMYFQDKDLSIIFAYHMLQTTNWNSWHQVPSNRHWQGHRHQHSFHNNIHLWS